MPWGPFGRSRAWVTARHWPSPATTLTLGVYGVISAFWLTTVPFLNDATLYRDAAGRLIGGDPWTGTSAGYSYAAPPLEALPFLPLALLPAPFFLILWLVCSTVAAVWIVRSLGRDLTFLLYPPLVIGVALGNPAVVGMACVFAGIPLVGLIFRPQLLWIAGRRSIVAFAALSMAAVLLRPDFIGAVAEITQRYATESRAINFWATPLMAPAVLALVLLARVDRRAAAWLVMPAIGPAMGWYGFMMVMPVRSRILAVACALPIPFVGATAIAVYAFVRAGGRLGARTAHARSAAASVARPSVG